MTIPSNNQRVRAKRDIYYGCKCGHKCCNKRKELMASPGDTGTWQGSYVIFDKDKKRPYRKEEYPLCIAVMWSAKEDNVGDIAEIENDLEYLEKQKCS